MINDTVNVWINFNLIDATKIEIQRYFGKLLADNIHAKNENHLLNIGNRLYVREGFSVEPSFSHILQFYFNETIRNFTYEGRYQLAQVLI